MSTHPAPEPTAPATGNAAPHAALTDPYTAIVRSVIVMATLIRLPIHYTYCCSAAHSHICVALASPPLLQHLGRHSPCAVLCAPHCAHSPMSDPHPSITSPQPGSTAVCGLGAHSFPSPLVPPPYPTPTARHDAPGLAPPHVAPSDRYTTFVRSVTVNTTTNTARVLLHSHTKALVLAEPYPWYLLLACAHAL